MTKTVALTSEDRVLLVVDQIEWETQRPVPLNRLVQLLRTELAGLDYPTLVRCCAALEQAACVQREWFTPADFNVRLLDRGRTRAETIAREAGLPREPAGRPLRGPSMGSRAAPTPEPALDESVVNIPSRILLFGYSGVVSTDERPGIPVEDLNHFFESLGVTLAPGVLVKTLEEMERRDFLVRTPRERGGMAFKLTPKGESLAEGLLQHPLRTPSPRGAPENVPPELAPAAPTPPAEAPAPPADLPFHVPEAPPGDEEPPAPSPEQPPALAGRDEWASIQSENVRLQQEVHRLSQKLQEEMEAHQRDRETLDEVLRQMEILAQRVQDEEEELQTLKGSPPPVRDPGPEPPVSEPDQ